MAQHDYQIANQSGAAYRADHNANLLAVVSLNSGAAEPTTTYAYMLWCDTTNGLLMQRTAANDAWVQVGTLDSAFLGLAARDAAQSFTKGQRATPVTLTDGANIATDLSLSNHFTVTLAGNRTMDNPTNMVAGQSGIIALVQDATGTRTLTWGSFWKFPSGNAPTLTTTANAVDLLSYYVRSATEICVTLTADFQ